jgi:polysaccharide chain length determinant protein (PEP-CTERM system associated)
VLPGRKYTPEDIVALVWRRKWLVVVAVCLMSATALVLSRRLPDMYESETLILVIPQRVPESYVRSTVTVRIEDRLRSISQEILNRSRLEQIIRDFNLYSEQLKTRPMEQVVASMRGNVFVDTVRDDAFKVRFVSDSPRTAMIVADRLATMFIEENVRDREGQATGTNDFLQSQLDDARARLQMHEEKLEVYRKRYSGELPTQLEGNLHVIQATQNQIQGLTESINRDRDRRLGLERSMSEPGSAAGSDLPGTADAPVDAETKAYQDLDKARAELRELQVRLRSEHPDVIAKVRAIADLERKVREAVNAEPGAVPARPLTANAREQRTRGRQYQAEIDKLDQQISGKEAEMQRLRQVMSDYQRRVEAVPGHESELTALTRDYETLQKIYSELLGKKESSQMSANLERQQAGEQFRILDPARIPERPVSPNRPQIIAIAAALGLLMAVGLIGFLEYRDMTLRTEDEIVRTLVLPVIAAIPVMLAVADVKRRRRNRVVMITATLVLISGATAALWQLGR